jgi:flagellar basal body-associated protein FliL
MGKAANNATEFANNSPPDSGARNWLVMAIVGLVAAGFGVALPTVFQQQPQTSAANGKRVATAGVDRATQNAKPRGAQAEPDRHEPAFIPFGEVVVNLAEVNLARYLRVSLTLQVDPVNEEIVKRAVERRKTILKNWLIAYLADKAIDEVRGAVGVNRARRDIQEQFNRLLFPDGPELIQDVLFEDFTVT